MLFRYLLMRNRLGLVLVIVGVVAGLALLCLGRLLRVSSFSSTTTTTGSSIVIVGFASFEFNWYAVVPVMAAIVLGLILALTNRRRPASR